MFRTKPVGVWDGILEEEIKGRTGAGATGPAPMEWRDTSGRPPRNQGERTFVNRIEATPHSLMTRPVDLLPRLKALLEQRIVLLDGAMGTMVQAHKLGEADYRGQEFAHHPKDLRLN